MVTRVITLFKFMSNIIVGNIFSFVAMILLFAATSKNNNIELSSKNIERIKKIFQRTINETLKFQNIPQKDMLLIRKVFNQF